MARIVVILVLYAVAACAAAQSTANGIELPQVKESPGWGKLIGRVTAVWLRPGDPGWDPKKGEWQMRLVAPFTYEDRNGNQWNAPAGCPIDGASIPKIVWSGLAGTPYTGHYREASVLHDRYCDVPASHTFRKIARMFYEAMRCEGTGAFEAAVKYYAVLKFGPQDPHTHTPARLPKALSREAGSVAELNFRTLVDEAGPRMNDDELATFYKSLEEYRGPTEAKNPTLKFVVPTDTVKGTQELRFKREDTSVEDKWHTQFERSGMDFSASPSGEERFSGRFTRPITTAAVMTTDKDSAEFYRAVKYLAKKANTITPEEIEKLADNGPPKDE